MLLGKNIRPYAGTTLRNGLTHHWSMDETSSNYVDDIGGLNLGTFTGTYNRGVTGKIGSAFEIPNVSGASVVGNAKAITGFPFSFSCWFKKSNVNGQMLIATNYNPSAYAGFFAQCGNDGRIYSHVCNNVGIAAADRWTYNSPINSSLVDNNWHHTVITVQNRLTHQIYTDGTLQSLTQSGAATTVSFAPNQTMVGNYVTVQTWEGDIDQIATWDRILTQEEVDTLYNGGAGLPFNQW